MRVGTFAGAALVAACLTVGPAHGNLIFSEDFNHLADGAAITTANTSLTHVFVQPGAEVSARQITGFGEGTSAYITTLDSQSKSGFAAVWDTAPEVLTMEFDLATDNPSRYLVLAIGAGATITSTSTSTFMDSHLFGAVRINGGRLERRQTGSWTPLGAYTSTQGHRFRIVANGSSAGLTYADVSLPSKHALLYVDGVLWETGAFPIQVAAEAKGFRFYGSSRRIYYSIDNIKVWSGLGPVPEPASVMLVSVGAAGMFCRRRR